MAVRAVLLALLVSCVEADPFEIPSDDATWRIYMAPRTGWIINGHDGHPGTAEHPIRTLNGAQRIAHELITSGQPLRNVEIRIAPGRYDDVDQHVEWGTVMAGHTITFLPWVGDVRPVFDGAGSVITPMIAPVAALG